MKKLFLFLLFPLFLYSKVQVTVTYPFEEFIVKKIGQKHVRIKVIDKEFKHKTQEHKRAEIAKLSEVKGFFHFNLEQEKEYIKILKKRNPQLNIFDMSRNIQKLKFKGKDNPYVWLDPLLLRTIAKNIYEDLSKINKFYKEYFYAQYSDFLKELDNTYLRHKKTLVNSLIYNTYVYDEYWDYFLKRYKINIYRREKRILSPDEISFLQKESELNDIKTVLITLDESDIYAKTLAGNLNLNVKMHNPFEKLYFYNLSKLVNQLK